MPLGDPAQTEFAFLKWLSVLNCKAFDVSQMFHMAACAIKISGFLAQKGLSISKRQFVLLQMFSTFVKDF